MSESRPEAGYLKNGMPYNRSGRGPRPPVVFQGLTFEHKPQPAIAGAMYRFLGEDYTVYSVVRKPGLPRGYTLKDMADDYAEMIVEEFGEALDMIGVSTGSSVVQHFAADHLGLVRRLVIHSSAYTLSDSAKKLQLDVARLAGQGKRYQSAALLVKAVMPRSGVMKYLSVPVAWLGSLVMSFTVPKGPNDLVVTVEAEDKHNFKDRLGEITAPALVIAGDQDPFYSPELFRDTAAGIPNARLIRYAGMGHPAGGRQFTHDVLEFLRG